MPKYLLLFFFYGFGWCLQSCKEPEVTEGNTLSYQEIETIPITNVKENRDTTAIYKLLETVRQKRYSNPDYALMLSKDALMLSQRLNNDRGMAYSLLSIGACLSDQKKIPQSKQAIRAALSYCQGNSYLQSVVYYNLANVLSSEGVPDSSLHYYFLSVNTVKGNSRNRDTSLLIQNYINIGNVLSVNKKSKPALHYLDLALGLINQSSRSPYLANYYSCVGGHYFREDLLDSARHYYSAALKLFKAQGKLNEMQENYYNLGVIAWKKQKKNVAKSYFDSAINVHHQGYAKNTNLLQGIAVLYHDAGDYETALAYNKRSIDVAATQGTRPQKLIAYSNTADIYNKTGRGNLAYAYQKAYSDLKDSLVNEEMVKNLNVQEVKYRVAEKDVLLAKNKLQLTRQYLWMVGLAGMALLTAILLISILRRRRLKEEMLRLKATLQGEEQERKRLARELHDGIMSRLYALKLRFDAYTTQNSLSPNEEYEDMAQQLSYSIEELRATAHNLLPSILDQEGLAGALQLYCDRLSKHAAIHIDFQLSGTMPAVSKDMELNIYRIVQELMQNILKHAQARHALVQITARPASLSITIDDDGIGMPALQMTSGNGIGMQNLHHRVKALNGSLEIESNQGTSVYLEFDIVE